MLTHFIRELQDDITAYWDESVVSRVLETYVVQNNITMVLYIVLHVN